MSRNRATDREPAQAVMKSGCGYCRIGSDGDATQCERDLPIRRRSLAFALWLIVPNRKRPVPT